MDATQALAETNGIVTTLVNGLTPDHREARTPCDQWNVHELIEHMCQGGHMIAGGLEGQAPPEEMPDYLAEGPANGWSAAHAALAAAATPDRLAANHQMPFGEVPGEVALSVISADFLVHAWDLAQATEQPLQVSDELAGWALATWQAVVPAEGRPEGGGFAPVVATADDAPIVDQLVAYTGRNPA
jgi:uncharacterized protein (TIGR03086 family)